MSNSWEYTQICEIAGLIRQGLCGLHGDSIVIDR